MPDWVVSLERLIQSPLLVVFITMGVLNLLALRDLQWRLKHLHSRLDLLLKLDVRRAHLEPNLDLKSSLLAVLEEDHRDGQ